MGFGGERNEEVVGNQQKKSNDISSLNTQKLSHLETDSLRNWAKQYGLDCVDAEREILLNELVRISSSTI